MPSKVILFEDNRSFANSLKLLINSTDDLECIGVYDNPSEILKILKETQPDVILMDIDMPKMSGIEAIVLARSKYPEVPIIMQTIFDENDKIYNSILAGANGYILKSSKPIKYLDALRDVLQGGAPMTASVASKVLNLLQNPLKKANENFNLTSREKEILKALVDGLSYKMISDKLSISYHTVNAHIRKIYDKLHVHSAAEAVSKAIKSNLLSISTLLFLMDKNSTIYDIFTRCIN